MNPKVFKKFKNLKKLIDLTFQAGSKYYLRSSSDFNICESQAGQPSASWNMEIKEHKDSSLAADLAGKSEVPRSKSR